MSRDTITALEAHGTPRVTLDTILAERAELATLIDTAQRNGCDIALVEVRQSHVEARCLLDDGEPVGAPSGSRMELALSVQMLRITGRHANELTAETMGWGLSFGLSPEILDMIGQGAMPPAPRRQAPKLLRNAARVWEILRILGVGSFGQRGFSTSFTPMQQRQLRVAASLAAHVHARRNIFVSDIVDVSARAGHRRALEHLLKTRIMTADEFFLYLTEHRRTKTPRRT